jgi:hypothetical protein
MGVEEVLDLAVRATDVNGVTALDNALRILGDAGDTVEVQGSWSIGSADSGGVGFQLVTTNAANDAVKILIENNVNVINIG